MENTFTNVLPENFNGVFELSNWSDEDFEGLWDGKAYLFPAHKQTPMIIANASPTEIQNIRKKFAKELAEREYFKSKKYEAQRRVEGDKDEWGVIQPRLTNYKQAGFYTESDLVNLIQRGLDPLPKGKVSMKEDAPLHASLREDMEQKLKVDEQGEAHTQVVAKGQALKLKDRG